jgi:hypothetical protein
LQPYYSVIKEANLTKKGKKLELGQSGEKLIQAVWVGFVWLI